MQVGCLTVFCVLCDLQDICMFVTHKRPFLPCLTRGCTLELITHSYLHTALSRTGAAPPPQAHDTPSLQQPFTAPPPPQHQQQQYQQPPLQPLHTQHQHPSYSATHAHAPPPPHIHASQPHAADTAAEQPAAKKPKLKFKVKTEAGVGTQQPGPSSALTQQSHPQQHVAPATEAAAAPSNVPAAPAGTKFKLKLGGKYGGGAGQQ